MTDFVVITGLSGAGRSQAAAHLEDQGWFVVDNLPPTLVDKVADLATAPGSSIGRVALVVGRSSWQDGDVTTALAQLRRDGHRLRILFLDCATPELVRRYDASRRRHPLDPRGETGLEVAIETERHLLEALKGDADLVIDTTALNVHELKARILDAFIAERPDRGMQTTILSFGFKHGLPLDVDVVLDCRFLPNPYWVDALRDQTGLDSEVRAYVLGQPATGAFLAHLDELFDLLLPAYAAEGKSYLTLAFGCTGGRHRSVTLVEELAERLRAKGHACRVKHRDVTR